MHEDVVGRAIGVNPAQRDGDELRTGGRETLRHDRARTEFAGAEKQPGAKGHAGNDERRSFHAEEIVSTGSAQAVRNA